MFPAVAVFVQKEWVQLHELAELLGASVGCSRPIAELGWEKQSHQIGQTGKGVSPKVYFARSRCYAAFVRSKSGCSYRGKP